MQRKSRVKSVLTTYSSVSSVYLNLYEYAACELRTAVGSMKY